jgi:uncharacterized membrane protein YhaH (DUF805 family)
MLYVLIALLIILVAVVVYANGQKKKGAMSDSTHQTLVSGVSILVTVVSLLVLVMRLRGR